MRIRVEWAIVAVLMAAGHAHKCLADEYFVKASGKDCVPGLHHKPAGGPFSVFVFCDDAAGSNIGVINTEGAAGPGKIELPPPKTWDKWSPGDRFWQQPQWASDVTSFAWSPDLKSLYVGTSYVYGSGELYKLDLVKRTFSKITPGARSARKSDSDYSVEITGIDPQGGGVSVNVYASDRKSEGRAVTRHVVR